MSDNLEALRALRGPGHGKPRVLENASFVNTELSIAIGPGDPPDAPVHVRNCSFSHCTARVLVMPGVELERVVLDNVESPESMTIDTHTVLREVIVKGSPMIGGGLWVKPILTDRAEGDDPLAQRLRRCAQWAAAASQKIEWMLDFSEYDAAHTEVVGLPLSKLKWNRQRHVALRMERTASELEKWRRLDLPVTSFWTLCMGRLKGFGATEGVFLRPSRRDRRYAQTNEEMMQLMDAGFLVSPE